MFLTGEKMVNEIISSDATQLPAFKNVSLFILNYIYIGMRVAISSGESRKRPPPS